MTRRRRAICLLTSVLLLLAQLHIWEARGCSMCGATCRCASHGSSDSCSVRSIGCGGGEGGAMIGSVGPLRAVLVASPMPAPQFTCDAFRAASSHLPPHPARPPLDRPPRVSC